MKLWEAKGVQTLLGKLNDQEKKTEDAEQKKENRQKIKEHWIPMILPLRMPHRKAKKRKKEQEQLKKSGRLFGCRKWG